MANTDSETDQTLEQIHREFVEAQIPFNTPVQADDPNYASRVLSRAENADANDEF